jgi:hypothetical protein
VHEARIRDTELRDLAAAIGAIEGAVAGEIIDLSARLKPMIRGLLR